MDFRITLLALLATTVVAAPLMAETPTAEACNYSYVFCPIDWRFHAGCGNVVTGPTQAALSCAEEATEP